MKLVNNPPQCLVDMKEDISTRRDAVARSIESLRAVKTYLPESGARGVIAMFEHLVRLERHHTNALATMTRIENAHGTWRQLRRSVGDHQYEPAARSLLDTWHGWHFDAEYQPTSKKEIDRAARTATSALNKLIALWERHSFLRDIKLLDALPQHDKRIELLDSIDEPLPVAFNRIITAINEHERGGGNQRSIPHHHEAAELAYNLTWRLHSDTGLTVHKAVAAITSHLLNKTITETAVRRAWDRSLK